MSSRSNRYHSPARSNYGSNSTYLTPLSLCGLSPSSYGVSTGYSSRSRLYSPSSFYTPSLLSSSSYSASYKSPYRDVIWSSYYTSSPRTNWYEAYKPTIRQRPSCLSSRRSSAIDTSPRQSTKTDQNVTTHGTINRQRKTVKFVEPKRKDSVPLDLEKIRRLSDAFFDDRNNVETACAHSPERLPVTNVDNEKETKKGASIGVPVCDTEANRPNEERQERQPRARRRSRDTSGQDKKAKRVSMEISDIISEEEVQKLKAKDSITSVEPLPPPPTFISVQLADNNCQIVMDFTKDLVHVEQGKPFSTTEVVVDIPRRTSPPARTESEVVVQKVGAVEVPKQEKVFPAEVQLEKDIKQHERPESLADNGSLCDTAHTKNKQEISPSLDGICVLEPLSCCTVDASISNVSACPTYGQVTGSVSDGPSSLHQIEASKASDVLKFAGSNVSEQQKSKCQAAGKSTAVQLLAESDDAKKKFNQTKAVADGGSGIKIEQKKDSKVDAAKPCAEPAKEHSPDPLVQSDINLQQSAKAGSKERLNNHKIADEQQPKKDKVPTVPLRFGQTKIDSVNEALTLNEELTLQQEEVAHSQQANKSKATTTHQSVLKVIEATDAVPSQKVKAEKSDKFELTKTVYLVMKENAKPQGTIAIDTSGRTEKVSKILKQAPKFKNNNETQGIPAEVADDTNEEKDSGAKRVDQRTNIIQTSLGKPEVAAEQTTAFPQIEPNTSHGNDHIGQSNIVLADPPETTNKILIKQIGIDKSLQKTKKTKTPKGIESTTKISCSTQVQPQPRIDTEPRKECEQTISEAKAHLEKKPKQEKVQEVTTNKKENRAKGNLDKDKDKIKEQEETKAENTTNDLGKIAVMTDKKPFGVTKEHNSYVETAAGKEKLIDTASNNRADHIRKNGEKETANTKVKNGKGFVDGYKRKHTNAKELGQQLLEGKANTENHIEESKEAKPNKNEKRVTNPELKFAEKNKSKIENCIAASRAKSVLTEFAKKDQEEKKLTDQSERGKSVDDLGQLHAKETPDDNTQEMIASKIKSQINVSGNRCTNSTGQISNTCSRRLTELKLKQENLNDQKKTNISVQTTEVQAQKKKELTKIDKKLSNVSEKPPASYIKTIAGPTSAGQAHKETDTPTKRKQKQKEEHQNRKHADVVNQKPRVKTGAYETETKHFDVGTREQLDANKASKFSKQKEALELPEQGPVEKIAVLKGREKFEPGNKTDETIKQSTDKKIYAPFPIVLDEKRKRQKSAQDQKQANTFTTDNEETLKFSDKNIQAKIQAKAEIPTTIEVNEDKRHKEERAPPNMPEKPFMKTKDEIFREKDLERKIAFIQQLEIQHSASSICLSSTGGTAGIVESKSKCSLEMLRKPPNKSEELGETRVVVPEQKITKKHNDVEAKRAEEQVAREDSQHHVNITQVLPVSQDNPKARKNMPSPSLDLRTAEAPSEVLHNDITIANRAVYHVVEKITTSGQSSRKEIMYQNGMSEPMKALDESTIVSKPPKSGFVKEVPNSLKLSTLQEERPASTSVSGEQQTMVEARLITGHKSERTVLECRATDEICHLRTTEQQALIRFRKYSLLDFNLLKVLGKGSFGKVFLVELRDVAIYFAMKCLKKDVVLEDDDVECTLIERQVLSLGSHNPFVCKLFCTFQTDSHLFFVMEFLRGGDLMFHVQNEGSFTEERARRGIVYRDLKLDNVCLDGDGHIRLIDFGMCVLRVYHYEPTAFCGTPEYMAPEVIEGRQYSYPVDWWSFGVVMYEMLRGRSPYTGCDEEELFWNVMNTEVEYPKYFSREAKNLIQNLLQRDPENRLGTPECGRGDIRDHPFFDGINWSQVERKQLTPHFKPFIHGASDVSNFDEDFTREPAVLTPIEDDVLAAMDQNIFKEFSYTNPNMTS
ncbi:uncharacterized protein LOC111272816 isoform X2 [Varroa jacobsoni]|uniref:uncharacterized protein LOC111272816 isoform X2 n=1 Tax=Varroa jacobsoni TaxID=62625 RepID=UPI000BF79137|nr:uncharacterized protein LOC111272816 isoform X2 [Varroa jacobsoni]